jgi:hypothetical protein
MAQMVHSLNKHYHFFIALGALITLLASVIAMTGGGQIDQAQSGSASTAIWLPAFRLLGITLILGGIVMALDVLCLRLPAVRPWIAGLVVPCMATSLLLATAGFIATLYLAGVASDAAMISGAAGVPQIMAAGPARNWLEGLQLVATALMLLAISAGLHTLFRMYRYQPEPLNNFTKTKKGV